MEFRFNLNDIFKEPFVEIGNSLIPPGFTGDKRALWDTQSKITQIVNAMGEASAQAQGLSKPITTAERLRNSEHKLYLLLDKSAYNGKGAVTGMLKTGEKGLYVFDREGQHYQVSPPCVLDFYIHESRQRAGYGKGLFEHMLQRQQIDPVNMAIDRPSDKLLGFLNKHYGLNAPVKQMNNFVVYDGFFPRSSENPRAIDVEKSYTPRKKQSANGLQHGNPSSPYGRYGAPRPPCSMGQIIHNDSAVIKRNQEPTGVRSEPFTNAHGQHYMFNGIQAPAWLATQSVPNLPYSYSQNQQYYAQNQLPYAPSHQYAPALQYPQYQQFVPNQNAQYPLSSGDHVVNQQVQQSVQQNQCINQNASQVYQEAYDNYTMGQGDATNQSFKNQEMIQPAGAQVQGQNPEQIQEQGLQNQNVVEGPPQIVTYQDQCYCFNPQTQQYHMVPNADQQMFVQSVPQNQQVYYNQSHVQADTQKSVQPCQGQHEHYREPLRPQNLDGTVRRVQQSVSMPVHVTKTPGNQIAMVHGTASAPFRSQHQQMTAGHMHYHQLSQAVTQLENLVKPPNQRVHQEPQYQGINQNQSMNQIANLPQAGDQTADVQSSANVDSMAYATENMVQAPQTAPPKAQPESQVNTPRNRNITYVMAQSPRVNQIVNANQAPVQQVANAQNQNLQYQQQPNLAYSPVTMHNQAGNMAYQTQSVQLQAGDQNAGLKQQVIKHIAPSVESTHSRIHNVASSQVNSFSPRIAENNQMQSQGRQNIQLVPAMTQGQNIPVQHTQQQIMHQHQLPLSHQPQNMANIQAEMNLNQKDIMVAGQQSTGKQQAENQQVMTHQYQNFGNPPQQLLMNVTQNENVVARQQQMGDHEFGQQKLVLTTKINAGQERHVRQEKECDLSKGYPPQHHERSAPHSTPKADRPQSLNIETAELETKNHRHEAEAEIPEAEAHELLDGNYKDADSLDGEQNDLGIEDYIEKIEITPKETTPLSKGSRSPGIEAAGIVTPGRNTPGLTEQGYFDLKFYHNKLW